RSRIGGFGEDLAGRHGVKGACMAVCSPVAQTPSVRPATIWIQVVELHAGAVLTNPGVRVTAN
ncbi:MAG: hypothetical protein ACI90M_002969, partial [Candidatus Azotimanducaceae bacterium]